MNISVTKASKEWGISRTTIYQKINDGSLSRTAEKKIDTSEMLRVFGEPVSKKRTGRLVNTSESTQPNSQHIQASIEIKHQLELERLKNEHLRQRVSDQSQLIENYQQQISQLSKTLEKANASIHDFTQVRLLEFEGFEDEHKLQAEQRVQPVARSASKKKKKWWVLK